LAQCRIINDTQIDPEHPERPFSKRQLVEYPRVGSALRISCIVLPLGGSIQLRLKSGENTLPNDQALAG
jgi:hypothetical protein